MEAATTAILQLLGLLLSSSLLQLAGIVASPLPDALSVRGSGRAEQGFPYSLTCDVEGLSSADTTSSSYTWEKDGKIIKKEAKQVLTFPRLTQDDTGNYQCRRELSDKTRAFLSEEFQLRVLVFENITMVPEVEVEEGETAIINCSVHSVPTAQLVWTRGKEILRVVDSNFDSLVLPNASQYHREVFDCQASNREFFMQFLGAYTQIRKKGTYEVIPKPVLWYERIPVLNQPFGFTCTVRDLPQNAANIHLTYTWFKDHRVISGQSGQVLQFSSLRREDGGMYQCRTRNGKPQTTSPESNKVDLLVLLPPRVHMEPATKDNVIRRAAGKELTLTCKVTEARPWVTHNGYSWSYLPSPKGQRRPLVGRENTLRLGSLTREDSGQYFCQARNDLEAFQGQIPPGNASITVDVVYMEQITLTLDLQVNEGDHLTLTCRVDSNPTARLSWIVDGEEVRYVTDNVDHLILERAACSDNKTYTCHASNTHLPDLEMNASTYVGVECKDGGIDSPAPFLSSQDKWVFWLMVVFALLVLFLIIAFVGLLFWKKRWTKRTSSPHKKQLDEGVRSLHHNGYICGTTPDSSLLHTENGVQEQRSPMKIYLHS